MHFALINQRDGFFIAGRKPDPGFSWKKLEGAGVVADHGAQPLAMSKYGLHRQGVDFARLEAIDAGAPESMVGAFKAGRGDYIHLQGPAPQQLAHEGAAHVLAAVGEAVGPVAFSSLCATRRWLATDEARAFTRAFAKSRQWCAESPPAEIARAEAPFLPGIARGGAGGDDRELPAPRQLAGADRDRPRARPGGARRVRAQRPDQPPSSLRERGRAPPPE